MNEEDQTENAASSPDAPPADLEALRLEVEEHRDRYLRVVAEMDNLRKRSAGRSMPRVSSVRSGSHS